MTDIEIAQAHEMKPITEIAAAAGIDEQHLELYGKYKAKLDLTEIRKLPRKAKLILVTAISPTPAGEGKTTTSVGLADALNKIGKKTMVCLREPSLGPVFGVKGGAAGGGSAQVVPMEDINLHFTGDFHAIGAANNLLAAMLDNHIQQGNALNIDPRRIVWKRAVDMNDRQLRHIIDGLGGKASGVPREDGFEITVASEIMAVLCLSSDLADLKARLAKMVVAYTYDDQPVTAHDLKAEGAMAALLKDAIKPNLVQTLEGTPAFIHGGPFANIAHGCNSLQATETAMRLSDYTVTEAGFAADLGAEKFLAVHFEFLARRAGSRNGEPHDDVADDEDAEQVAHHRTGPAHEGNPLEDGEQYRQEHGQPYPDRIDVEILADAGADAAQLGVFGVAVETARDARLFGASSRLLFGDVLGGAHLPDDVQNQGLLDHTGAVLSREDQFGDAGFDVGDDLGSVGSLLVGLFQAFEIGFQLLISVGIHRERHARNAAFLNLFHGCSV